MFQPLLIGLVLALGLLSGGFARAETRVDLAFVRDLLAQRPFTTVESFLAALPESYRASYTLLHTSRSLQGAEPRLPRAILYGPDARLILTFNGTVNQAHGNKIELAAYDEQDKAFVFHEIDFNGRGKLSAKNPAVCIGCHQADPRPNWESYPVWPGAYGGNGDAPGSAEEQANLAAFLRHAAANPRYATLPGLAARYEVSRPGNSGYAGGSNRDFSERVSALNFERVARLIRGTPDYRHYKYAILASIGCPSPSAVASPRDLLSARGISTEGWSMSFTVSDEVWYQTPGRGDAELAARLAEGDPDLRPFLKLTPFELNGFTVSWGDVTDCAKLARESQAALSAIGR